MRDAKKFEPDVLVVVMDNDWSMALVNGLAEQDLSDEFSNFDQFSIADKIEPLFTERIETEWSKQPRLVFWVKQAMGGAAFLPFTSPEIYFSRDARLGGIGYLDRLFGSDRRRSRPAEAIFAAAGAGPGHGAPGRVRPQDHHGADLVRVRALVPARRAASPCS